MATRYIPSLIGPVPWIGLEADFTHRMGSAQILKLASAGVGCDDTVEVDHVNDTRVSETWTRLA